MVDPRRVKRIKDGMTGSGPVVYWMSRDQRVHDNWALLYAQETALELRRPLRVVFVVSPSYPESSSRHYDFMLEGLRQVERELFKWQIAFDLQIGSPPDLLPRYLRSLDAACAVTDFDPLRIKQTWLSKLSGFVDLPIFCVDAHNVIPCWEASSKQEFSARFLRLKISNLLSDFFTDFPSVKRHPYGRLVNNSPIVDWDEIPIKLHPVYRDGPVFGIASGENAARMCLKNFCRKKIFGYAQCANDPNVGVVSGLSPYLHFGQIASQRAALEVLKTTEDAKLSRDAFIEQLIIRKELSDNFCYFNPQYDQLEGIPAWARDTLSNHGRDRRKYIYSRAQFESAQTHDPLWNVAQKIMIRYGWMHGYLRMYWAKKILEWSKSPHQAFETAVYLNNRYFLDGRDPNGYVGIGWSIGGVHDRPWPERAIFGKIRYMNYKGCERKFDVAKYIADMEQELGK